MPIAIPAAIAGVAAIGGAVITSSANKSAANKATAAQTTATNNEQALQQQIFQQNQQNEQPFLNSGYGALAAENQLLGLKPLTSQQFNSGQWFQPGTVDYGTGAPVTAPATNTPTAPHSGYTGPSLQQIMQMGKSQGQSAINNYMSYYQQHPEEDPGFSNISMFQGDQFNDENLAQGVLGARSAYTTTHPTTVGSGAVAGVGATGFSAQPAGGGAVSTTTNPLTVAQHAQAAIQAGADPQQVAARIRQLGVNLN